VSKQDGELHFISRHDRPIDVCDEIRQAVTELDLPENSMLDCEWMARRPNYKLLEDTEKLYILGLLWWEDEWMGRMGEAARYEKLLEALGIISDPIRIPDTVESDLFDFFEQQVNNWITEGVVLKHKDAKLIGNRKECKKNNLWNKVKWRDGNDGMTIIYVME